jgi:hypothetical protein
MRHRICDRDHEACARRHDTGKAEVKMKHDVRESGQNRPAEEEGGGTGGCGREFFYTVPSVCLPNSWRTPIHSLSDTYPTPIRHLSDIYPTSIRHLSDINQAAEKPSKRRVRARGLQDPK